MKHKHSDLIKAWADGAEIQYYNEDPYNGIWRDGTWRDVAGRDLNWHPEVTYRIKPSELNIKYKLMQQAVAEYKEKWITTDQIVIIPTRVTVRYTELVLKEAISVWERMDNGNAVAGYVEMEDYPKAILKYFGIEK